MPRIRIRIAYELPTFNCSFTINFGGDADAAMMLREVSNEAKRAGLPPAALFTKTVLEGPKYLRGKNPVVQASACTMITAWALQQPSHGGTVLDYLPVYDFEITITEITGAHITYEVGATAREGLGTA
jgi:hypothetical protein